MTLPTHPLDVQRLLRDWRTSMDSTEWTAAGDRVGSPVSLMWEDE